MPLPQPGTTIRSARGESFAVGRVLGTGGMGTVVEARHEQSGRRVALKFLHDELLDHPTIPRRFAREVELATSLSTAHVARTFGVETAPDGSTFMIMEMLEGGDLCTLVRAQGRLSPTRAAQIVAQACEALEEAHARGIVHRDLKPENLFITRSNDGGDWVKVLDFGISKVLDDVANPASGAPAPAPRPKLTRVGTTVGTPEYMAPEQLRGASDLDGSADVYSLGVVLYETLSGRRPFVGKAYDELVRKICTEDPIPLLQVRPEVPVALADVVARAMARDRRARIPTARALRDALMPFAVARRAEHTMVMEPPTSARGSGAGPAASTSGPHAVAASASPPRTQVAPFVAVAVGGESAIANAPSRPSPAAPSAPVGPIIPAIPPKRGLGSAPPIADVPSIPRAAAGPATSPLPSPPSSGRASRPMSSLGEPTETIEGEPHVGGGGPGWPLLLVLIVVALMLAAGAVLLFFPHAVGL